MNTPEELRLVLIDNKGGVELSHFDNIPHLLYPTITSTGEVLPALESVHKILNARLAAFKNIGARNLQKYNKKARQKLPRIIVVVDEMATIIGLGKMTADIHNELRVLTSQGRAVGVNMVICTQHPSVDVLPGWIKTNMTLRIASRMPNHVSSQIVVDSITASLLPDVPGRMVFRRGGFEMVLQTPLIEDAGVKRAVKLAREFKTDVEQLPMPEASADPKFTEDDFLKIAVEQLDNHLSPNRAHEIVGNEVVKLRELRVVMHNILQRAEREGGIMYKDKCYQVTKKGRGYYLIEQVSPIEQPKERNLEKTLDKELFHHVEITTTN
jgi:DNA segregation ATPase FtsK/SpoIIIE-like protein